MPFRLFFQPEALLQLYQLEHGDAAKDLKKLKKVRNCLGLIETNPKHPELHSHKYRELKGLSGEDVWESYVENQASAARRVFWHYGPEKDVLTIVAITAHP